MRSFPPLEPAGWSRRDGEVYRARDTRLGRDVAIKVLPDALADDPERIARFEREAKTLAAGGDDFDSKPVQFDRLLQKIEMLLKGRLISSETPWSISRSATDGAARLRRFS